MPNFASINPNARWISFQILQKLYEGRSNSSVLLQQSLPRLSDRKDRHLATDLVLGVLRWQKYLDFLVARFSKRSRLDAGVKIILRLGLYQLLYTSIPKHAAIHETVKLCTSARLTSASGFVNGILREADRRLSSLPCPENEGSIQQLATRWSHPEWLVQRWRERFGMDETVRLLQVNNQPPPLYIRVNELQTDSQQLRDRLAHESVIADDAVPGVLVIKEGNPQFTNSFSAGDFYIQDAAIKYVGDFIEPQRLHRILEVAAAPGGKTFELALRTNDSAFIVAIDNELRRIRTWKSNIQRLGLRSAHALVADAATLPLAGSFDLVFIDAPCSSLGVLRRHPEIKWRRTEKDLLELQEQQLQILQGCAKYVRDTGELIYSVCSFEPEETTAVAGKFLESQPDFSIVDARYIYPHRDQTDGFYVVKFRRD